jgi:hypothetical protein
MMDERMQLGGEPADADRRRFLSKLGGISLAALATMFVPRLATEARADDDDDDDDGRRRWRRRSYRDDDRRYRYSRRRRGDDDDDDDD